LQQQEILYREFADELPEPIKSGRLDGATAEAELGTFAHQSAYQQAHERALQDAHGVRLGSICLHPMELAGWNRHR